MHNGHFFFSFVVCFTSQQHACVSQERICSDKLTCCHTEIDFADQTFYLTQPPHSDTGSTSPCADPMTPDARQGSQRSIKFDVTRPEERSSAQTGIERGSAALEADALTTCPARPCMMDRLIVNSRRTSRFHHVLVLTFQRDSRTSCLHHLLILMLDRETVPPSPFSDVGVRCTVQTPSSDIDVRCTDTIY